MKTKKTIVSSLQSLGLGLGLAFCALSAHAAEAPKMPPSVNVQGRTLQLNGVGLRTATVLRVKVYEGGLYLPQRSSNAQQILNSSDPKVVRLAFLRDVSANQVRDTWKEDFKRNCEPNCAAMQPQFDQLVSKLPDAKSGDVFAYVFTPKGIGIVRNGKEIASANNPDLARTVLSFWLGKNPPSIDLKQAMLGMNRGEEVS